MLRRAFSSRVTLKYPGSVPWPVPLPVCPAVSTTCRAGQSTVLYLPVPYCGPVIWFTLCAHCLWLMDVSSIHDTTSCHRWIDANSVKCTAADVISFARKRLCVDANWKQILNRVEDITLYHCTASGVAHCSRPLASRPAACFRWVPYWEGTVFVHIFSRKLTYTSLLVAMVNLPLNPN